MNKFATLGIVFGVVLFGGCKKDSGPHTVRDLGASGSDDPKGSNTSSGNDFAKGGAAIDNTFEDDPLALRNPALDGFSDPVNVIRPFDSVFFGFDQYSISSSERPKVEEVAAFLKKNSKAHLVIEGYCDWKGTPEYNKSLGDRRASSVKNYLIDLGCDSLRIEVVSIGDEKATPNASSTQARMDRCAQFLILKGS